MAVSFYDRLNAALVAVLLVLGSLVAVWMVLWLDGQAARQAVGWPELRSGVLAAVTLKPEAASEVLVVPSAEEFAGKEAPALSEALLAVTAVVPEISLDRGSGSSGPDGNGSGRKLSGPSFCGPAGIPFGAGYSWEVDLEAPDREVYARQLGHFGIAIGALQKSGGEVLRWDFPAGKARASSSSRKEEDSRGTVLFCHRQRRLQEWDRALIGAPVAILQTHVIGLLFPRTLLDHLRSLETEHAARSGRSVQEIHSTGFRIVENNGGFRFEVSWQTWRD